MKKANTEVIQTIYRYLGPRKKDRDRCVVIDDETALWAARMIVGEGGKNCSTEKASAQLWALINRWMLHPGRRHWPTFLFLMRRFSQPINPRWMEGGDLARKYAGTKHCTPAKLRRRAQIASLTWNEIPTGIARVVRAFRAGTLQPPAGVLALDRPRISNWASHAGLKEKYPWGICFDDSPSPDWFFEDRNLTAGNVFAVRLEVENRK